MNLLPTRADFQDARRAPLTDILAGVTVAIVALPLALAFGIASGLGAEAGITTAIIAGAIAAVFGGSRLQVSGPTGAMTVVLVPIVHQHGTQAVLLVGLMAGIILVTISILKVGEHIHRLPTALIEGFTAGIAVVIALQQFPYIFGVEKSSAEKIWLAAWDELTRAFAALNASSLTISLSVFLVILIAGRIWKRVQLSLAVVAVVTILANVLNLPVQRIGELPATIGHFGLSFLTASDLLNLIAPAFAVAVLAALESLLSAKIADKMHGHGEHHDSNRELFGQGLANIVVPFFGGVPATAALARTAVNVRAHAQSKLAALFHSVVLAAVILFGASLVAQIPLSALAGVLLATTTHMVKWSELIAIARKSRLDAVVLVATFLSTVFIDLISAVVIGSLISLMGLRGRSR